MHLHFFHENKFDHTFYNNAWPRLTWMTLRGYMLPGWQYLATCYQDDNAWLHVARMTILGHILPGWQYLATSYQDVNTWSHLTRMTILGHILSGWQFVASCCQDDNTRQHLTRMTMLGHMLTGWYFRNSLTWDIRLGHIHHIHWIYHRSTTVFLSISTLSHAQKIPFQKRSRICI